MKAFWGWIKSWVVQVTLLVCWGLMLFVTGIQVAECWARPERIEFDTTVRTAGILLVCALPNALMLCLALMSQQALGARLKLEFASGETLEASSASSARVPSGDLTVYERARRMWAYEAEQTERAHARYVLHAGIYGFVCSSALLCCTCLSIRSVAGFTIRNAPWRVHTAIAIFAAVSVSFAKDFGRMLTRVSMRDSSVQMLAWSSRRLLLVIVATVVFVMIGFGGQLDQVALVKEGFAGILLGASVAVLGDRLTDIVSERAAKVLGVTIEKKTGDSLRDLVGVEEEDVLRLAEAGIDCVHALALASTPKLFFGTPYPLLRICDWQDQALLAVCAGSSRAQLFRDQLMVRGAIDAQLLAERVLTQGKVSDEDRKQINTVLGFGSAAQADVAFRRLAADESVARLRVYRAAAPTLASLEEAAQQ